MKEKGFEREKAWERLTGFFKLRKNKKGEWIREGFGRVGL